jgi:hypothetical protein
MSQADILAAIKRVQPFEPLQLVLSSGEKINLTHPDAILVGKTATAVSVDGLIHLVSNIHITRISPLAAAVGV